MTSQQYPTVGLKGFKSQSDVEAYLAAFSADEFDTYFQYYHPDIYVSASPQPSTATKIATPKARREMPMDPCVQITEFRVLFRSIFPSFRA
jgi:hypothetical protein